MVRFMAAGLASWPDSQLLGSFRPGVSRYGGWGGWGGGVGTAQGSMMRGAGVAAAGAGAYNQQTAVARSINANTAMQVNQYMYEVNKTNAKYYYTRSANRQKEESSTGEAIYKRLHDNPSSYDIHTGDALNVVLDELTNPAVYTQVITGATRPIDSQLVKNIEFEYAANMIAISLADFSARGVPDYLMTTDEFAPDRATIKELAGKVRSEIQSQGQASPETLAKARVAINALKTKADELLPQGSPNRLEVDNYLKALYRPLQDARDTFGGSVPLGAEKGGNDDTGAPDRLHAHLQLAFRRGQDADPGADLRSALPAARRGSRPGQGAQRESFTTTSSGPQDPKSALRVFLGDAVRLETRRRASRHRPASRDERDEAVAAWRQLHVLSSPPTAGRSR